MLRLSYNNTEEERMRVFPFVKGFLHINKLLCTFFFLARLVSLPSYPLSPLVCFKFFESG